MKKTILLIMMTVLALDVSAQQRHRFANGEPYDLFFSIKPVGGMAIGEFNKNTTYLYGAHFAFELQMEETRLGLGLELGYNYCVPQSHKIKYLPAKYNWAAHQVPIMFTANYYLYNESIKPFVGLAVGTIWGRYDYSLSTEESIKDYYLRDFEGQSGLRLAIEPRVGLLYSHNHRHAFGLEVSLPYAVKSGRLESQYSLNIGLNYTFIID